MPAPTLDKLIASIGASPRDGKWLAPDNRDLNGKELKFKDWDTSMLPMELLSSSGNFLDQAYNCARVFSELQVCVCVCVCMFRCR